MIYSEPLLEIITNKPSEVKELYLAKKGFTHLRDFDRFINLEILWINNNLITEVINLDACTRIRKLYLQDNKITTLTGSISKFKFLTVLLLHNNLLRDLNSILDQLVHHRHLKQLNLLGNPCAEEEGYREIVISRLPILEIFDRHVVTAEERALADQTLKKAPQLFRTSSDGPVVAKKTKGTKTELLVEKEAQRIKADALRREKIAQQLQQDELDSQIATRERALSDTMPLPEALDFLKQRQLQTPPSPSSSSPPLTLPPITKQSTLNNTNNKNNKSLRSEYSMRSDISNYSETQPKSTFKFETFSYYNSSNSNSNHNNTSSSSSSSSSSTSPYKTSGPQSPPPRVSVNIK